jgi:hypothetical protein
MNSAWPISEAARQSIPKFRDLVRRGFRDGAAPDHIVGVGRVLARSLGLSGREEQEALGVALLEERRASHAGISEWNEFLRVLIARVNTQWEGSTPLVQLADQEWEQGSPPSEATNASEKLL